VRIASCSAPTVRAGRLDLRVNASLDGARRMCHIIRTEVGPAFCAIAGEPVFVIE
jgi:hypothetical protein